MKTSNGHFDKSRRCFEIWGQIKWCTKKFKYGEWRTKYYIHNRYVVVDFIILRQYFLHPTGLHNIFLTSAFLMNLKYFAAPNAIVANSSIYRGCTRRDCGARKTRSNFRFCYPFKVRVNMILLMLLIRFSHLRRLILAMLARVRRTFSCSVN